MLDDYQLIIRLRRGDKDALRLIYHKYKDAMYTAAVTLVNDYAAAQNILSDSFLSFAGHAPGLAIYKSVRVFLARCIIERSNAILKQKMYSIEEVPRTHAGSSAGETPADAFARQHTSAVIEAMSKVPQPQRQALVLNLYAGLNFAEIAQVQQISTTAAKDRCSYALEKLAGILDRLVENIAAPGSVEDRLKKIHCAVSSELDEQILHEAQACFERASKIRVRKSRLVITAVLISATLIICAVIFAVLLSEREKKRPPVVTEQNEIIPPQPPQITPAPKLPVHAPEQPARNEPKVNELERIEIMANTGDVLGLASVLRTGNIENKLTAIKFLSRMPDPRAAEILNSLAAELDPNNPQDHLLAQVLGIEGFDKLEDETEQTEIIIEPNEQKIQIDKSAEQYITGWLIDENGYTLQGKIYVGKNPAIADANGMFSIPRPTFDNFLSSFGYALSSDRMLGTIFHWNQYDDLNDIEIICSPLFSATGSVVDANSQPLNDFQLRIIPEANEPQTEYAFEVPWKFTIAPDGSFDVNSIPAGYPLELIISRDDSAERVFLGDTGFEVHMQLGQIILDSVIELEPNSG